jgi:hypothetical protein
MTSGLREELESRIAEYERRRSALEEALSVQHAELAELERRLEAAVDLYQREFGLEIGVPIRRRVPIRGGGRSAGWTDAIETVLSEAGGPLHVQEIWGRLAERGFETDSSDPARAIVSMAVRNPARFARVAPNTFALRTERSAE